MVRGGWERAQEQNYSMTHLREKFVRQGCYDVDCASKLKEQSKIKRQDDIIP